MVDQGRAGVVDARGAGIGRFRRGWLSSWFVTDLARMECVLDQPYVLLLDGCLSSLGDLLPLLDLVARSGRPLLLVAQDVEGEALGSLVVNHLRGRLQASAIRCPAGADGSHALADLAALTGATVLGAAGVGSLESATLADLGTAWRVVVRRDHTDVVRAPPPTAG